jgi:hypothetical protein
MFDNRRREGRLMTPEKKVRGLTVTNRSQHGAFVPQVRMMRIPAKVTTCSDEGDHLSERSDGRRLVVR